MVDKKGTIYNPFGKVEFKTKDPLEVSYILQSLADTVVTFDGSVEFFKSLSDPKYDSAQVSDIISFGLGKLASDAITTSEGVYFATARPLGDSGDVSDLFALHYQKNLTDAADVEDLIGVPDGLTYSYAMSKGDAAAVADVFSRTVIYNRSFIDAGSLSDTPAISYSTPKADSASPSDAAALLTGKVLGDAGTISDAPAFASTLGKSDTASAAEDFAPAWQYDRSHSDASNTSDAQAFNLTKVLADTVTVIDSDGFVIGFQIDSEPADSSSTSDAPVFIVGKVLTNIADAAESLALFTGKTLADTANPTDAAPTFIVDAVRADSAQSTDVPALAIGKPFADSAAGGDVITSFGYGLGKADAAVTSESLAQVWQYSKPHADSSQTSDAPVFNSGLSKADSAGTSDTQSFASILGKSDSASVADSSIRSFGKNLADAADAEDLVGVPDGITYQFAMTKADTANAGESLARAWAALRSYADSSQVSDAAVVAATFNEIPTDLQFVTDSGELLLFNYFEADFVVAATTAATIYNAEDIVSLT